MVYARIIEILFKLKREKGIYEFLRFSWGWMNTGISGLAFIQ